MLNRFRTKQIAAFSAFLIVLSLMVKMMMPVAHASTAMTGEKTGFFAALCTANGVVLVNPEDGEPFKAKPKPQQIDSTNLCPLCLLLEQGLYDSTALNADTTLAFARPPYVFSTHQQTLPHPFASTQRPIRAPPVIS